MITNQPMGDRSEFKLWGLGIVTQDKPFGIDNIAVTSLERIPDQVGSPIDGNETFSGSAGTTEGVSNSQELKGSKQWTAQWLPNGHDHLLTSPMVRKGETVKLYKYADKPEFYWTTIFREPSLRRIERFIIAASDLAGGLNPIDMSSIYYMDFDTLSKAITIKTAISDGEKFLYTFMIDAAGSRVRTHDNIGNTYVIDSESNNVYMEDAAGGKFETRDGHPRIYGPKGILLETPEWVRINSGGISGYSHRDIRLETPEQLYTHTGDTSIYSHRGIQMETPEQLNVHTGDTSVYGHRGIQMETPERAHIQSGNTLVDGPTQFNNEVDMKKTLAVASGINVGYNGGAVISFNGTTSFVGNVKIDGRLDATTAYFPGGHGPHNGIYG